MIIDLIDKLAQRWIDYRTGMLLNKFSSTGDLEFIKAEFDADGFSVDLRGDTVVNERMAILARDAAEFLEKNNVENYVQFEIIPRLNRYIRPVLFTVQWANGKSPAQRVKELEEEVERLKGYYSTAARVGEDER